MSKEKFYIAGGISGFVDGNLPQFREAQAFLVKFDIEGLVPQDLCDVNFSDATPEEWSDALWSDIEALAKRNCRPSAIFLLPGHHMSTGATAELAWFRGIKLDVWFYSPVAQVAVSQNGEVLIVEEGDPLRIPYHWRDHKVKDRGESGAPMLGKYASEYAADPTLGRVFGGPLYAAYEGRQVVGHTSFIAAVPHHTAGPETFEPQLGALYLEEWIVQAERDGFKPTEDWLFRFPNIGECYICGHPADHYGHPHGEATGDGKLRAHKDLEDAEAELGVARVDRQNSERSYSAARDLVRRQRRALERRLEIGPPAARAGSLAANGPESVGEDPRESAPASVAGEGLPGSVTEEGSEYAG